MESDKRISEVLENKKYKILYNGVDVSVKEITSVSDIPYYDKIISAIGPRFISVSTLNYAKGVERIPRYLASVRLVYPDFRWIIIGNGIRKNELQKNIVRYGLDNNVIWIDYPIPNDVVLKILSLTDYYIMLHRWSIFDLATLEAMGMGNIPILSNVGGNVEVIMDNNGELVNEGNIDCILDYVNETYLENEYLKQKNREIQEKNFSLKSMLQSYKNIIIENS
jgi:glycosyltransferase involved in cell wall biosynthesis